jgi:hypothetical protein
MAKILASTRVHKAMLRVAFSLRCSGPAGEGAASRQPPVIREGGCCRAGVRVRGVRGAAVLVLGGWGRGGGGGLLDLVSLRSRLASAAAL